MSFSFEREIVMLGLSWDNEPFFIHELYICKTCELLIFFFQSSTQIVRRSSSLFPNKLWSLSPIISMADVLSFFFFG